LERNWQKNQRTQVYMRFFFNIKRGWKKLKPIPNGAVNFGVVVLFIGRGALNAPRLSEIAPKYVSSVWDFFVHSWQLLS
jgi:hypothetical protein